MESNQYSEEMMMNVIHLMAQVGAGLKVTEEECEKIPVELHKHIAAALLAANTVKAMRESSMFDIGELMRKVVRENLDDDLFDVESKDVSAMSDDEIDALIDRKLKEKKSKQD